MTKKLFRFLPLYTVAAGIVCCILRGILFGAKDEKGLLSLTHPANVPLILLSVIALILLGLYGIFAPKKDFRFWLSFPLQDVGCLAAAIAHFTWFLDAPEAEMPLFLYTKLIVSVLFLVLAVYRRLSRKAPLLIPALLSLGMMLLCFSQYRQWGEHTQVLEYLFPAFSALFIALYSLEYCYMELPERNYKKTFLLNQAALFCTLVCFDGDPYSFLICVWLVSGLFASTYRMVLPEDVQYCMHKLEQAGFTVHAVGGCVRDAMLGQIPHDYDLCTNATPEQICTVFSDHRLIRNGEKHGTIGVVRGHTVYEITTYRTEGGYADNRHPDSVTFVDRIEEDLARRDFTVNAMAFHPKNGYIDPFGGEKDLCNGVLRAVGDPESRFREDALRILRGMRFACRFRLTPEHKTLQAMETLSPLMENLAAERVFSELTQTLCHIEGDDLLIYRKLLLQVIPELQESVDFQQNNPHHAYDVFTHTAYVVAAADKDPALRWAALLHDVGKPQTYTRDETGIGHFYGHAKESALLAQQILQRLKAPTELREQVLFLIEHHVDNLSANKVLLRKKLSKYGCDNLRKLILLQLADQSGKGTPMHGFDRTCEKMMALLEQLEKEEGRLQIRDLAIDGHDLMKLGFEAGPALGQCQKQLLELVLSGETPNEKDALLQKAKELLNN